MTNKCGFNTTTAGCGSGFSTYCNAGYYYPSQTCSSIPATTVCLQQNSSNSCAICGNCTGGSDTCNAVACGTTNSYGCGSGKYCGGTIGNCQSPFGNGASCNCSAQCSSGNCSGGVCIATAYYQNTTYLCGYQTTTTAGCGSGLNTTYCTSGTYYPTQSCLSSPAHTACISQNSSASCAVCGNCSGSSDTCNPAVCGTTNSYGCGSGKYCGGAIGNCQLPFSTGSACNCSAQCASPNTCVGNVCTTPIYYKSMTNLCGFQKTAVAGCGSGLNTTYCGSGKYYPNQTCSSSPNYTACQSISAANSCAVCGNCTAGSDTCSAVACGTTNSYGCGSGKYCGGTIGNCQSPFANGANCNCSAQCSSGSCRGGVCTTLLPTCVLGDNCTTGECVCPVARPQCCDTGICAVKCMVVPPCDDPPCPEPA